MKHKVSELEGALLDAAVAKAEGRDADSLMLGESGNWLEWDLDRGGWRGWVPSSDWRVGGPIIEREGIPLNPVFFEDFVEFAPFTVEFWEARDARSARHYQGQTPLIAAMRAYVASKFGEEVEL